MRYIITQPRAISELGQRPNQEDALWPRKGKATNADRLFLVCDGMGGHESGEMASGLVSKTMGEFINQALSSEQPFSDDLLLSALAAAYEVLDANDTESSTDKAMGTTLTLLYLGSNGVTVAHIGDSRIYQIRPSQQKILYHSRDHSLVYDLFLAGEITEEQMASHPQKNIITRSIMSHQEQRCEPEIHHLTNVLPGDYFYLCTDGMLEQMSDSQLLDILSDAEETDEMKALLLQKYTAGNRDNHSAYLIHVKEVVQEMTDVSTEADDSTVVDTAINPASNTVAPAVSRATTARLRMQRNRRSLLSGWMAWLAGLLFILLCTAAYCLLKPNRAEVKPRVEADFSDPAPKKPAKTARPTTKKKSNPQRQKKVKTENEAVSTEAQTPKPLFTDEKPDVAEKPADKEVIDKIKKSAPKKRENATKAPDLKTQSL